MHDASPPLLSFPSFFFLTKALYAVGVRRLVRQLRELEREVNAPLLCKGSLEALHNKTAYVPGLWEEKEEEEEGNHHGDDNGDNGAGGGSSGYDGSSSGVHSFRKGSWVDGGSESIIERGWSLSREVGVVFEPFAK
jgi:hypothetical protein